MIYSLKNAQKIYLGSSEVSKIFLRNSEIFSSIPTNNVSLLLHADGTEGSQVFTDSSINNFQITPFGNVQISTAVKKFGSGSAFFDGNGDYLLTPSNEAFAFGTNNYTVEFWVNVNVALCQNFATIIQCGDNGVPGSWQLVRGPIAIGNSSPFQLIFQTNLVGTTFSFVAGTLTNNEWVHFAISRQTAVTRTFVNGNIISSNNLVNPINYSQQQVIIGSNSTGTRSFAGYIDELRITKGLARYTSNFTPENAPFT